MRSQRSWVILWAAVAGLATLAYLAAMLLGTGGRLSLPLDDSFIFFQYAREFALGHPFRYNGTGAASGGATSVPMLLVDTVAWLVGFRGDGMVVFSLLLGGAALAVALTAAWRFGQAFGMRRPWWPPLFVLLSGPILWGLFAGMDLPLFVAPLLMTLAAWTAERQAGPRRGGTLLWGSLTAASRPEGLLFGLLLATLLLVERRGAETAADPEPAGGRTSSGKKAAPGAAGWLLLPVVAGLVPPLILLAGTGRPSPSSLAVKGVLGLPGVDWGTWIGGALEYFNSTVREILLGFKGDKPAHLFANNASGIPLYLAPLTFVLYLIGVVPAAAGEIDRRRPGPSLFSMLVLLAGLVGASLVVPKTWHWHRYLIPYYALILPFAAIGLERLLQGPAGVAHQSRPGSLAAVGLGLYVTLAVPGALYFLLAFAQNSADIAFQQRGLAEWANRNIPAGSVLGVNDAGVLRYYGTHAIVDLEGLVTPALTEPRRHGTSSLYEALERMPAAERPAYFIIYPNWYDAALVRPQELIYQRRILRQTIAGGNPMNVYRADWSAAGSGDLPSSPEALAAVAGRRLVDRIDVSDLADEKAHDYQFRSVEGQYQGILEAQPVEAGGSLVIDGGRLISGGESFTVRGLTPGRDVTMALRSKSGFRIQVSVDGGESIEWLEPGRAGTTWTESTLTLPGRLIGRATARFRVAPADLHSTVYTVFHYWLYQ